MRLFGRHAFAFDNRVRATFRRNAADYCVRFRGVFGPVKLGSARFSIRDELLEIPIQMSQCFVFDRARLRTQVFPVGQTRGGFASPVTKQRRRVAQSTAQLHISQRGFRILIKCLCG